MALESLPMVAIALPLALSVALSSLGSGGAPPPAPTLRAEIVGRLVFRQGGKPIPLAEVQRLAGGKRIALALRSGWRMAEARLDPDGRFTAQVEPGTWRLEAIDVGSGAEVLATPLEIEARDGRSSCAGQITLTFDDLASELGTNAAGSVAVEDHCAEIPASRGGRPSLALARPGEDLGERLLQVGALDVLYGFRAEGVAQGEDATGLRFSWSIPFHRPLAFKGNFLVMGAVERQFPSVGSPRNVLQAGAGFCPFSGIELTGGLQVGAGAALPFAGLRWGNAAFAVSARAFVDSGKVTWAFGLDLTPVLVLGAFL